jgi:hypothetical protein
VRKSAGFSVRRPFAARAQREHRRVVMRHQAVRGARVRQPDGAAAASREL